MLDIERHSDRQKVAFGAGIRHALRRHAEAAGCKRVLVLTTPGRSDLGLEVAGGLGPLAAGVFAQATMHTPTHVTDAALAHLRDLGADAVVAVGGGSAIGLGKALALRAGITQIALPTTYAGSECTPILGQTEDGVKTTLTDPAVLPSVVLYDPDLVATLPVTLSVASALNAMAHAVEALYAQDRDADSTALALDGLAAFRDALPDVVADPADRAARTVTQQGAWACGTVLGRVGMALHHKLCHTLGGALGLPHAETHAIVLPHATAYNQPAAASELAPVAAMFGADDAARGLWDFARGLGAPTALRDLGVTEDRLPAVARQAAANPYWNPRPITEEEIGALLRRAWEGAAPHA